MTGVAGTRKNKIVRGLENSPRIFYNQKWKEVCGMIPIIHNLTINLDKPTLYNNIVIKQGDRRSRRLVFNIISNNKRMKASDIYSIAVKVARSDEAIIHGVAIIEDEKIYYDIEEELTSAVGEMEMELEIIGPEGSLLYSPTQYITVKSTVYDTNALVTETQMGGIQAYVSAAYAVLKETQLINSQFGMVYGTFDELLEEMETSKYDYVTFLETLKKKVEEGYFNGERGPKGEDGENAVVADGFGIIGFQIVDGNLICYYYNDNPPPFEIDDNGQLVYRMEE